MSASNLAIIPARGGSKRIPRKNIKDFLGKPVIAYSIEVAIKSGLFAEVMVSTDDEEIRDVAIRHGAVVPFLRTARNSSDYATTLDVIKEVIYCYTKIHKQFLNICCIYATAPLVQVQHLQEGYKKLVSSGLDSVFPVVPFSYPIWRGLKIEGDKTSMIWPQHMNSRSQDLPQVFHDAGQWYWLKTDGLQKGLFNDNSGSIVLSETEVQDIDTLCDWQMAEMKFNILNA